MKTGARNRSDFQGCRWFLALAWLLWQVTVVFVPSAVAADASSDTVRLANGEWPPYTGQHLPSQGCDSQVVTEAFALEGIQVQYEFFPWARGLLLSQNGVIDGAVEWAGTPEQQQAHFVSKDGLSQQQWVFFHRKDAPLVTWQSLDDLTGRTIGLTIGYAYSDVFAALRKQRSAMFQEAANDLLNFRKLLGGRIDLFPLERAVGYYLMHKELAPEELARLTADSKPLAEFTPHLLLSRAVPENKQRMQLFDRGLDTLKAKGRYREIMARCSFENP